MMTNSISRGELWLETLAPNAKRLEGLCPSVQAADGELNGETVRFVAVVPDANNHSGLSFSQRIKKGFALFDAVDPAACKLPINVKSAVPPAQRSLFV